MRLSLCMIVKDEVDVLARCLDSVKAAVDEIVIVDTGSTDGTKEIARRYTDKVYDFDWIDDFSAARNFSFEQATGDYILWLDADDIFPPGEVEKLIALKATLPPEINCVMMPYAISFDPQGKADFTFDRERIVRNAPDVRWTEPVHEVLTYGVPYQRADIWIHHRKVKAGNPLRNLEIYRTRIAKGEVLSPRGTCYFARELMHNQFLHEAIPQFTLFLETKAGWVEDNIRACLDLAQCHRMLGDNGARKSALLRSFAYDAPRPEGSCLLGDMMMEEGQLHAAQHWYELALQLPRPTAGFITHDYSDLYPCLQLCVCHDRLGNREYARAYNERAAALRPDHPSVRFNRQYFEASDSSATDKAAIPAE